MEGEIMKWTKWMFACGRELYDFYVLPTIHFENRCDRQYFCLEWLYFYIGVRRFYDEE